MGNDYLYFLQRLKEEREQRNLTQQWLCRCMGMQQGHYSKAETGQKRFTYQELKGLCTSHVDVLYAFTGKKAEHGAEFWDPSEIRLEEILCHLNIIYILVEAARLTYRNNAAFENIRKQLEYMCCTSGRSGTGNNIFHYVRDRHGYTQQKMADILGMDIKKLRALEQGKRLPDSEIIWKMYDRFQVSPAFILRDPNGLCKELNYVLSLLADEKRDIVLQILANMHALIQRR